MNTTIPMRQRAAAVDSVPALHVDGLRAGYQGSQIVRGVSLDVGAREILAIVGRNGVGKTTLVKAIVGLVRATAGRLVLAGTDITRLSAVHRVRRGIGYVPQGRGIFTRLTVSENLRMGALVGGRGESSVEQVFEWFPILKKRLNQNAGTLSGGEQQMLSIGRVLSGRPGLLILDEPSEGVQPNIVEQIAAVISERNAAGLPVIIVEQNIDMLEELAHRCVVIDKGGIAAVLPPAELARPEVARQFLAI
jgi:branched-chain amino acid transport system ATP-binding protein